MQFFGGGFLNTESCWQAGSHWRTKTRTSRKVLLQNAIINFQSLVYSLICPLRTKKRTSRKSMLQNVITDFQSLVYMLFWNFFSINFAHCLRLSGDISKFGHSVYCVRIVLIWRWQKLSKYKIQLSILDFFLHSLRINVGFWN